MINSDRLFEMVNAVEPVDRARFDDLLTFTVGRICAICGRKYVFEDRQETNAGVYSEYEGAIASGILYCLRRSKEDAENFLERLKSAFVLIWRQKAAAAKKEAQT